MYQVEVKEGNLELSEQVLYELKKLQEFQITLQEMKNEEEEIKEALYKAMYENGVKSFESDFFKINLIEPTTVTTIDSKRLKEECPEIAETYSKTSEKKGYVKISYK